MQKSFNPTNYQYICLSFLTTWLCSYLDILILSWCTLQRNAQRPFHLFNLLSLFIKNLFLCRESSEPTVNVAFHHFSSSPFLAFHYFFTSESSETLNFHLFTFFYPSHPFSSHRPKLKSSCQNTFSRPRSLFEPSRVGHPVRELMNVKMEQVRV